MHTEDLTSDMPTTRNQVYDITLSILLLCESGRTRIDWGPLDGCLSRWYVASCETVKSLLFKIAAAEGAAGSVIQPSGLPDVDMMLPLFFFLCRAGEYPDACTCAKCCELDGAFMLDVWEKLFEPEKTFIKKTFSYNPATSPMYSNS